MEQLLDIFSFVLYKTFRLMLAIAAIMVLTCYAAVKANEFAGCIVLCVGLLYLNEYGKTK